MQRGGKLIPSLELFHVAVQYSSACPKLSHLCGTNKNLRDCVCSATSLCFWMKRNHHINAADSVNGMCSCAFFTLTHFFIKCRVWAVRTKTTKSVIIRVTTKIIFSLKSGMSPVLRTKGPTNSQPVDVSAQIFQWIDRSVCTCCEGMCWRTQTVKQTLIQADQSGNFLRIHQQKC